MKISVKEAATAAIKHFTELNHETNVTIEETRLTHVNFWLITLGYYEEYFCNGALMATKVFKEFKIDALNSNIVSMKIKKV